MRFRRKYEKKKTLVFICLLLMFSLSLGYAFLSEQLKVDGTLNYGAMSWDVGFSNAYDGGGTVSSSSAISQDKKTISVICDIGTTTNSQTCITKATVVNNSTFAVELENTPNIVYDARYVKSINVTWTDDSTKVQALDFLTSQSSREMKIEIVTNQLTEELLPSDDLTVPITVTMNWVEAGASISNNVLANKSALFIGDSVQYGYGNNGKGWSYYIDEDYSMGDVKKVAVSGSSFTKNSTGTDRIINQFKNLSGTYDYVILEGAINDLTYGSTWGTLSNDINIVQNSSVVVEAIEETIHTILTKYPNANVGYILLYNTEDSGRAGHDTQLDAYHELILSIFNKWNIPVFDMYANTILYEGERTTFDELLDIHNTTYLYDGLHLNDAGYQLTYKYIGEWMKTLKPVSYPVVDDDSESTEPEQTIEYVTIDSETFISVDSISKLGWTKGKMVLTNGKYSYTTAEGRIASVGFLLKVNGGETIKITDSSNYNFALYEMNDTGTLTGAKADAWLSDSVELNANTRYVKFYLKKINETAWTNEEIANLPNILILEGNGIVPDEPDDEIPDSEPENTETKVTFNGNTYDVVGSISDLSWTKGYQLSQGSLSYTVAAGKTGRVASVGYLLKVNGGETITISQGDTYNFAIVEVGSNGQLTGIVANQWITDSVTLNTNTKYVGIYLKRVDEVDWTNEEINNMSNILNVQ